MASANLFQQYLQPVRSVQDYAADMDKAEANQLALQGQRRQNEIAALTADQTRQTMASSAEDRNALQRLAATWGADTSIDQRVASLRNSGRPALMQQADALEKQGLEKQKTGAEVSAKNADAIASAIKNSRTWLDGISTPEQYIAWHEANHRDPALGPYLEARGITADQARANIEQALKTPGGFERMLMESKLGAEKTYANLMKQREMDETARRNKADESLTRRGQDITASNAKAAREQSDRHFKATQAASKASGNATEGERNAAGYLMRMTEASKLIDQFEGSGAATYGTQTAAAVPFVGGAIRRAVMTPEQQQYRQAQEDWVRAKLRKESGASIATDEMDREIETYFPMPGEGKEVIAQKRKARATANAAMRQSSGRAATPESVTSTGSSNGVIDFGSLK